MKNIMVAAFGLLILVSSRVQAQTPAGIAFEHKSWSEIVQKAKAEKKLIFMDAYTTWCGPCKALQARVFPDKTLGDYFNANFVNAKIDMESGEGPALAAKYRVQAYPTLMFIDPRTGKVVMQALGFRNVQELLLVARQANMRKPS